MLIVFQTFGLFYFEGEEDWRGYLENVGLCLGEISAEVGLDSFISVSSTLSFSSGKNPAGFVPSLKLHKIPMYVEVFLEVRSL